MVRIHTEQAAHVILVAAFQTFGLSLISKKHGALVQPGSRCKGGRPRGRPWAEHRDDCAEGFRPETQPVPVISDQAYTQCTFGRHFCLWQHQSLDMLQQALVFSCRTHFRLLKNLTAISIPVNPADLASVFTCIRIIVNTHKQSILSCMSKEGMICISQDLADGCIC